MLNGKRVYSLKEIEQRAAKYKSCKVLWWKVDYEKEAMEYVIRMQGLKSWPKNKK